MWYKTRKIIISQTDSENISEPLSVFHGTSHDYEGVPSIPKRGQHGPFVFVTEDEDTAKYFARGDNGRVLSLHANIQNPFSPNDIIQHPFILKQIAEWANNGGYLFRRDWTADLQNPDFYKLIKSINSSSDDSWLLENSKIKRYLKSKGYDAIQLSERGVPTYAVFDSKQLSNKQ
jgi:hypothetical protein